jgi:predicted metal-binding membrane protein
MQTSNTTRDSVARSLPRRDRIAILVALAGVTALAWLYLLDMAIAMRDMPGMQAMAGMDMGTAGSMLQLHAWTPQHFAMMFGMWAVMMVGMMVPTAAPMALVYAAVARKAARQGTPVAPTAAFVAGYVAMWTLFSLAATLAQWGLDRAALLSPMMVSNSPKLGAALLFAAGAYQLTPWKDRCLEHCRAPAHFISENWRPGTLGAFRMGLVHGAYCLGCCWILMGLLFLGGVMNLLWIAAITLFVLLEKVIPAGPRAGRIAGLTMIAAAVGFLAASFAGS